MAKSIRPAKRPLWLPPPTRRYRGQGASKGTGSVAAAASNPAMTTANRTSVVAGHAVVFDITKDTSITQPPADSDRTTEESPPGTVRAGKHYMKLWYSWNFGDSTSSGSGGTWTYSGRNRNIATGYVCAHTYETAGTYTVTLTITNESGVVTAFDQTITVTAFVGSTYYVDTATGNDADDGLSEANAFATLDKALDVVVALAVGTKWQVLLKRGQTFTWTAGRTFTKEGPHDFGVYGSGAKPIVNYTAGGDMCSGVGSLVTNLAFELSSGWTATGWTITASVTAGKCTHDTGNTTDLSQTLSNMNVGQSYRVTYTLANRTAGSVTVKLGTGAGTSRSSNGVFTETITCAGSNLLAFTPTSDFDGSVTHVYVDATVDLLVADWDIRHTGTTEISFRPGNFCTYLRLDIVEGNSNFSMSAAHGPKTDWVIQDCVCSGAAQYAVFGNFGRNSAILGCRLTVDSSGGEHQIRTRQTHSVVSHCDLHAGSTSGKLKLNIQGFDGVGDPVRNAEVPLTEGWDRVEFCVYSDNKFRDDVAGQIQQSQLGACDGIEGVGYIYDCIYERNYHILGNSAMTNGGAWGHTWYTVYRNNRFDLSIRNGGRGIQLKGNNDGIGLRGNHIINNSFFSSNVTQGPTCVRILTTPQELMTDSRGLFGASVGAQWTFGTGWTHNTGATTADHTGASGVLTFVGTTSNGRAILIVGRSYTVTYVTSGVSGGDLFVSCGSNNGASRTTNGSFSDTITCAGTAVFSVTANGTINIDTISIKPADTIAPINTVVKANYCVESGSPGIGGSMLTDNGTGTVSSNPAFATSGFVDAANDNFHLAVGASAIDAGLVLVETKYDADDVARHATTPDAGAYEKV